MEQGGSSDKTLAPATINERFIAYVLDLSPFLVGCTLSLWAMAHSYAWPLFLTPLRVAALWILAYGIYQFVGVHKGGTIGKRLMGIAVVDGNGQYPGLLQSLVRAFGQILSSVFFNFGFWFSFFRADSRALHDLMSGTSVIQSRPKSRIESNTLFIAAISVLIFVYGFLIHGIFSSPGLGNRQKLKKSADALYLLAKIEDDYKARHGTYTDSLADLALASGNADEFRAALRRMFEPDHFEMRAGTNVYWISAVCLDQRRTRLIVEGPPPRVHR